MNPRKIQLSVATSAVGLLLVISGSVVAEPSCSASAHTQRLACEFDLRDDFFTESASCLDVETQEAGCFSEAELEFDEGLEECGEVLEARLDLCELLDDATHDPEFGPDYADSFVDPREIGSTIAQIEFARQSLRVCTCGAL